jgi:hypothetical protein
MEPIDKKKIDEFLLPFPGAAEIGFARQGAKVNIRKGLGGCHDYLLSPDGVLY